MYTYLIYILFKFITTFYLNLLQFMKIAKFITIFCNNVIFFLKEKKQGYICKIEHFYN